MERSTILERSRGADAARFNALADPARLAILDRLRGGTRCVCELRDELGMAPNLLSYHLRILREAGFVEGERQGRRVEYRMLGDAVRELGRDVDRLVEGLAP
jgi:ArsR family transcriptional regulator